MYAGQLESFLSREISKTDLSFRPHDDVAQRFESLRGYGLLPKGRGKNRTKLAQAEIVAGVLSIATVKPGYAGLAAITLKTLRPVGGVDASFMEAVSFGDAVAALLDDPRAIDSLLELRMSESETYTNAHGRAAIAYKVGAETTIAHYVGQLACSLLEPGGEKTFDPRQLISSVITETVIYPSFFRALARNLTHEWPPPPIDPEEEDEETRREERARRLHLTSRSRFLNMAVDNQVTWPRDETAIQFEGYRLILMPKTGENSTSLHIDLSQGISGEQATTLMNRFLSLLTWCDDQYAVLQEGWSGNPVPVSTPRRNLAFTTAYHWVFDRKTPQTPEARKAIAIYREGRNAEENYLIGYAVLCFYKIIELRHSGKAEARTWFRDNYSVIQQDTALADRITAFESARGTELPHDYLYRACRTAVAHANKPFSSDPDDLHELRRLHVAADILRALARHFIETELGVSDCPHDGT